MASGDGLSPGQEVEVRVEGGQAVLEPTVPTWHLERQGRFTVLVPDGPVPPLTDADVREAIERGRDPEDRDAWH